MSEERYTPGPWGWRDVSGAGLGIYGDVSATMGKDFSELVQIFGLGDCGAPKFQIAYERWVQFPKREWDEMQRANARLIAAAPELLEALRDCREALRRAGAAGELEVVDAAIFKATGSAA